MNSCFSGKTIIIITIIIHSLVRLKQVFLPPPTHTFQSIYFLLLFGYKTHILLSQITIPIPKNLWGITKEERIKTKINLKKYVIIWRINSAKFSWDDPALHPIKTHQSNNKIKQQNQEWRNEKETRISYEVFSLKFWILNSFFTYLILASGFYNSPKTLKISVTFSSVITSLLTYDKKTKI